MRLRLSVAYGLILGSVLSGPALAIEHEVQELPFARPDAVEQSAARPDAIEQRNTQSSALRTAIQDLLAQPIGKKSKYEQAEHAALVKYYSEGGKMLWVDKNGLRSNARLAIGELTRAADYGLNANDYDIPEEIVLSSSDMTPLARLAESELKMSHAALAYARHARGGRKAPQEITYNLDPTLDLPDPAELMERMAVLDDPAPYLRSFNPKHEQFEALRQVLLRIRGKASGERHIVIPNGPTLRPGVTHQQIALLRKRLKVPVPMKNGGPLFPADVYDSALEMAVKAFQKTRGLAAEGIVGPQTRRALNGKTAPKNRVKTILANMERWRWVPGNLDKLNVQVNIPEFRYRVYDGNKVIHAERIVVGKPKNQTPVFSNTMQYLVFNPYWNVPNGIKREKIIPYLNRGGGGWFFGGSSSRPRILQQQNMFVSYRGKNIDASAVNWNKVNIGLYRFYQMPGPNNALGAVKFMFPNKHVVYMHDTPTKSLFDKTVRAYSYGCVRVRNPRKLAEIILSRDRGWSSGSVGAAFKSKKNQRVNLKTPVPVNITYFTARVEKNGKVTYFGDLYGHDARMARALKL